MEIINDITSIPFTSIEEMKNISIAMDERRKLQKTQRAQQRNDAILTVQCNPSVAPSRMTAERKLSEIVPSISSAAPEREYKPRKKREIF